MHVEQRSGENTCPPVAGILIGSWPSTVSRTSHLLTHP
jgi:hypothetical protein